MSDNWSEFVEIMKPIIGYKRNRTEITISLESCLRTLGWRTSTGSMQKNYRLNSGKIVDIVLGSITKNGVFIPTLPIQICSEELPNDILENITSVMYELNVRIAIVAGNSFDLYFCDKDSNKVVQVSQICFDVENEEGVKFCSLLSASDFNVNNLIAYYESLFNTKLPYLKIDAILNDIISDQSKAEEVLRAYLGLEGFEGEIVDNVLEKIGINIFYKSNRVLETEPQLNKKPFYQPVKSGHDNTRFALNGGAFLSKRSFVHSVVAQYIKDNPMITLDELESRFPSELASRERGVVRTLAQVESWARQYGPDVFSRYCSKENEILTLFDGTKIVVNNQWGTRNFPRFLALAKTLYTVTSDAPYEEFSGSENTTSSNTTNSSRAKNFNFSMAGIKIGETIIFDPTQTRVKVVSEDSVEYEGNTYRLTTFVRTYLPDNMRIPSDSYRGPDYFSYNGKTLTNLRNNCRKEGLSQPLENGSDELNKGIQISLNSYNSFKTKK